jgi:hypothetical protein
MADRQNDSASARAADEAASRERYRQLLDAQLDEALKETFPASDPIAVTPHRGFGVPPPETVKREAFQSPTADRPPHSRQ